MRTRRPRRVAVNFKGIDFEMDTRVCWEALVRRVVEGELRSMEDLAAAAGLSRSTVSRFFGGRRTSLKVALAILGELQLAFEEVFERPPAIDPEGIEPPTQEPDRGSRALISLGVLQPGASDPVVVQPDSGFRTSDRSEA
jgi:transcriptional regulator with XRE-family HTH domain